MTSLRIEGQRRLKGEIEVRGSKNAVLKLMGAALLTSQTCRFTRVPRIEDVFRMIELLESIGASCTWIEPHTLEISAVKVDPGSLRHDCVSQLRSSAILFGAVLGRCGGIQMPGPGGDKIGARSLDAHFLAFKSMGIEVKEINGHFRLTQKPRDDVRFTMSEFSVMATENAVLAAVTQAGKVTIIDNAAIDPSVQDLSWWLRAAGARIEGIGTHTLKISGVRELRGVEYDVMPDPVEAGTFMCLAAAARADVVIRNVAADFLKAELQKFGEMNVKYEIRNTRPSANPAYSISDIFMKKSARIRPLKRLHNMPYPGFSPDIIPPTTVLLTQAAGTTLVHDWMYEGRLKYVEELNKMGAGIVAADPHRIYVKGPVNLYGSSINNYDIRAGASLVIASLIAAGTSVLSPVYQLDRGYEALEVRLKAIGAQIQRVET